MRSFERRGARLSDGDGHAPKIGGDHGHAAVGVELLTEASFLGKKCQAGLSYTRTIDAVLLFSSGDGNVSGVLLQAKQREPVSSYSATRVMHIHAKQSGVGNWS